MGRGAERLCKLPSEMDTSQKAQTDRGRVERYEDEFVHAVTRAARILIQTATYIRGKVDEMSAALEALEDKVTSLEGADETLVTNVSAVVTEVSELDKEITELKEGNKEPAEVEKALESLATRVGSVTTALDTTVESLKNAQPAPAPTLPPAEASDTGNEPSASSQF